MANFTDTNLPQFKPYVSEMSPEIFHEVGQQKQQQYNQGVQLIQSQINNVAGLDVLRGVDKDYLHSKLNELGSNLSAFAASDFSDNQLVNSVSGMANSVAKDQRIQNAVYSTQRVRNESANMQQAQKDGKSHVANEWWFNNQLNEYANSTDPNATFNGKYVPYTDFEAKADKVLKTLIESGVGKDLISEDIYARGDDGKIRTDSKGNPIYADAMQKIVQSGIPKEKIEAALRASLDDNDLQQMQISGAYEFRDYDKQRLLNEATSDFNSNLINAHNQIGKLQVNALAYKADASEYDKYAKAIKAYQEAIAPGGSLETTYNQQIANIQANPDAVKTSLYKEALITGYANSRDSLRQSVEYMENYAKKEEDWRADYALKSRTLQETMRHNVADEKYHNRDLDIKAAKEAREEAEAQAKRTGVAGFTTYGALKTDTTPIDQTIQKDADNDLAQYNTKLQGLADQMNKDAKAAFTDPKNKGKKLYAGGIEYDAEHPITPEQVQAAIKNYYENPNLAKNSINPSYRKFIGDLETLKSSALAKQNLLTNTKNEADNDPEIKTKILDLNKEIQKTPGMIVGSTNFSSQEMMDYYSKRLDNKNFKYATLRDREGGGGPGGPKVFDENVLTPKEKLMYEHEQYVPMELRRKFSDLVQNFSDVNTKRNDLFKTKLSQRAPNYVPSSTEIVVGDNDNLREHYMNIAVQKAVTAEKDKTGSENLDPSTIQGWAGDEKVKKQLQFFVHNDGTKKYLQIINPQDKSIQLVPLESSDISQLPIAQPGRNEEIKKAMIMSPTGTTTDVGENPQDPSTAFLKMKDLHNIKTYKVTGNIHSVLGSENEGYPVINVHTTDGWKPIELISSISNINPDGSMNFADAKTYLENLTDKDVENWVKLYLPEYKNKLVK